MINPPPTLVSTYIYMNKSPLLRYGVWLEHVTCMAIQVAFGEKLNILLGKCLVLLEGNAIYK